MAGFLDSCSNPGRVFFLLLCSTLLLNGDEGADTEPGKIAIRTSCVGDAESLQMGYTRSGQGNFEVRAGPCTAKVATRTPSMRERRLRVVLFVVVLGAVNRACNGITEIRVG